MRKGFTLKRSTDLGFTLIEVLVAMGIMAMIFGAGMVSFQHTNQTQSVEGAADRIRQAMVVARSNALNGKKDCSFCNCDPASNDLLKGWTVSVSANKIVYQGVCGAGGFGTHIDILPANVTVSVGAVTFIPLGGGTELTNPLNFTVTGVSSSKVVKVNVDGSAEVL